MLSNTRHRTITQEFASCPKVNKIINDCINQQAVQLLEDFEYYDRFCESPIEQLLLAALYAQSLQTDFFQIEMMGTSGLAKNPDQETIYVHQQMQVGQYRVDFLIFDCSCPFEIADPTIIVVECDGNDFHEKTKEQAARDKKRDRFFQGLGFKVLRFTGSEIWADAHACVEEIIFNLNTNNDMRLGLAQ
jgi:very-short-patch-repair endonuclease